MPFIDRDGIRLYYETHGTGRPLLFLSETACHGDVWKLHQVPAFSRDHQVILCDYRGTGRSDWPSEPYNVKDFRRRCGGGPGAPGTPGTPWSAAIPWAARWPR